MVARITRRNAKYTTVHPLADELIARANSLRSALLLARTQDELVYGRVVTAQAMPKGSPEESRRRREALQATLAEAAAAPLQAASLAVDVLVLAERALGLDNAGLVSDLGCAAEFAGAAFRASSYNVRVNHAYLRDTALLAHQATVLSELAQQVDRRLDAVRAALEKHDLGP
jgi:formiminotetrahydrofolate cyclodeaminase